MYNRCTCLLQPYRHLTLKLLIQGHPQSAKVPHIADFKSVYNSLIIDSRGLQCQTNLQETWAGNLLMWSDATLDPSFKVKQGYPNLKVLVTRLLLVLEVCNVKPTSRKSWAGNLMMLSALTLGPSLKVKRG